MPESRVIGADPLRRAVDRVQMHTRTDVRRFGSVLDVRGDRIVRQLGNEIRLPVVLHAFRHRIVEQALQRRKRHDLKQFSLDFGSVPERLHDLLRFFVRPVPARHEDAEQVAYPVFRNKRQGRRDLPAEKAAELLGRMHHVLAVALEHRLGIVELEEHRAAHDVADLVELKLEVRNDPEIATTTAQCPEEILILVVAGGHLAAVSQHDIGRQQVVDRKADASRQVSDATAQRQATHPGRRDDAAGRGETERIGCMVDITQRGTAADIGDFLGGIDLHVIHPGQVKDQPVVDRAKSRDAVPAAANCQIEAAVAGGCDCRHYVRCVHTLRNRKRLTVMHAVVDGTCIVISGVRGRDYRSAGRFGQSLDRVIHGLLRLPVSFKVPQFAPPGVPKAFPAS